MLRKGQPLGAVDELPDGGRITGSGHGSLLCGGSTVINEVTQGGTMIRALLVAALLLTACDGGGEAQEEAEPEPTIEDRSYLVGTFISWEPVDDARGYANFTVTNNGTTTATAECSVSVSNDFGNFGFDKLVGETVPAGETISLRMALDVGEGSALINEGEVTDC